MSLIENGMYCSGSAFFSQSFTKNWNQYFEITWKVIKVVRAVRLVRANYYECFFGVKNILKKNTLTALTALTTFLRGLIHG